MDVLDDAHDRHFLALRPVEVQDGPRSQLARHAFRKVRLAYAVRVRFGGGRQCELAFRLGEEAAVEPRLDRDDERGHSKPSERRRTERNVKLEVVQSRCAVIGDAEGLCEHWVSAVLESARVMEAEGVEKGEQLLVGGPGLDEDGVVPVDVCVFQDRLLKQLSVARFVGARYRDTIQWSLRIRSATGPKGFEAVLDAFARFPDDVLAKVESAGRPLLKRVVDSVARALAGYPVDLEIRLIFELSHREEFSAAVRRLR